MVLLAQESMPSSIATAMPYNCMGDGRRGKLDRGGDVTKTNAYQPMT